MSIPKICNGQDKFRPRCLSASAVSAVLVLLLIALLVVLVLLVILTAVLIILIILVVLVRHFVSLLLNVSVLFCSALSAARLFCAECGNLCACCIKSIHSFPLDKFFCLWYNKRRLFIIP